MTSEREAVELFCKSHAMEPALFSVRQVSEAVGLSRSMLVELEQKGFLMPARVNPKTGYPSVLAAPKTSERCCCQGRVVGYIRRCIGRKEQ